MQHDKSKIVVYTIKFGLVFERKLVFGQWHELRVINHLKCLIKYLCYRIKGQVKKCSEYTGSDLYFFFLALQRVVHRSRTIYLSYTICCLCERFHVWSTCFLCWFLWSVYVQANKMTSLLKQVIGRWSCHLSLPRNNVLLCIWCSGGKASWAVVPRFIQQMNHDFMLKRCHGAFSVSLGSNLELLGRK